MGSLLERSFPPYFLEHRKAACEPAVIPVEGRPIWFLQSPGGWSVNSIVIEGDDGLIVYDTGVCHQQGQAIAAEIRRVSEKPIAAIIYSHHHADHCQGTDALVTPEQVASGEVEVLAWHTFDKEHADENRVVGPIMGLRALFMYGATLPAEEQAYTGLGSRFVGGHVGTFIAPNRLIEEDSELEIAGLRVRLFLTGGEASSEMGLYLPDLQTAVIADEVYAAMPNLYTLRGAKFRDAMRWAAASDRVLDLDVEVLLGCHMAPIVGREEIRRVLRVYRDAIQFNHDQAVRRILAGATPEELRDELRELPPYLDLAPFTREMYGKVAANAAQQFTGYLGWFEGDATSLSPTPRRERAKRLVALMGGGEAVLAAAREALDGEDPQWAAEVASLLVSLDPEHKDARAIKAAALRTLGYRELNATWRNWYLTGALELEGTLDVGALARAGRAALMSPAIGAAALLDSMRFAVNPEVAGDRHLWAGIEVVEPRAHFALELRNSVLQVHERGRGDERASVTLSLDVLARFVSGRASWQEVREDPGLVAQGDASALDAFFACFETGTAFAGFHTR